MGQAHLRLAILLSGGGRTLANLHLHIATGRLDARVHVVISSRANAHGVARSKEMGLPVVVVDRRRLSDEAFHHGITEAVEGVDLVCMAGFLSLWQIPDKFHRRVINIHPALLPEFGGAGMYGRRVHQAVLDAGRTVSGCTVHFCDNQYDHGSIILQRQVPVFPRDSADDLAARVFEQECIAYPQAIHQIECGDVPLGG